MVGAKNEMGSGQFHVRNRTRIVFQNSIHIELTFAIRRKRVVMAVDQEEGARNEPGNHAGGLFGVEFDEHEALPGRAVALGFGPQLAQEGLFEL